MMNVINICKDPFQEVPWIKDADDYWTDAVQQSVLFMDILRKRGNIFLEHQEKGQGDEKRGIRDDEVRFAALDISGVSVPEEGLEDEEKAVSAMNDRLCQTFLSPWIRAGVTEFSAQDMRQFRLFGYAFSDMNPFLAPIKHLAPAMKQNRRPVSQGNLFLEMEKSFSEGMTAMLNCYQTIHHASQTFLFTSIYDNWWMRSFFSGANDAGATLPEKTSGKIVTAQELAGTDAVLPEKTPANGQDQIEIDAVLPEKTPDKIMTAQEPAEAGAVPREKTPDKTRQNQDQSKKERWVKAAEKGDFVQGIVRIVVAMAGPGHIFSRKELVVARKILKANKKLKDLKPFVLKHKIREQSRIFEKDEQALTALGKLIPGPGERADAVEIARAIADADFVLPERRTDILEKVKKALAT